MHTHLYPIAEAEPSWGEGRLAPAICPKQFVEARMLCYPPLMWGLLAGWAESQVGSGGSRGSVPSLAARTVGDRGGSCGEPHPIVAALVLFVVARICCRVGESPRVGGPTGCFPK